MNKNDIKDWANKNLTNWLNEEEIKNLFDNDKLIECINNCTSPRVSEDKEITKADLEVIFKAFLLFKPDDTRVLILGQDPYPDDDKYRINHYGRRAHGLAFSFLNSKKDEGKSEPAADSLVNIFKAIAEYKKQNDDIYTWNTNLEIWAKKNGILLLNTALTHESKNKKVIEKHTEIWESFIFKIISKLLKKENNKLTIFLWGKPAQKTFLKCLNKEETLNFVSENVAEKINCEQDINKKFVLDKKFKVICLKDTIEIANSRGKILIFMTNHPSFLSENIKKKYIKFSQEHFKACDEFLENPIFKNFPENNKEEYYRK